MSKNPQLDKDPPPQNITATLKGADGVTATGDNPPTQLLLDYGGKIEPTEYHREDYAITVPQTLEWRSAWLRAVALAWADPKHMAYLTKNPYDFIQKHCGYALPKTVNLVVVKDPIAKFTPRPALYHNTGPGDEDDLAEHWKWDLTRNVLVMFLPEKPQDSSASDALIALAAFESVGSAYPFTMTC